MAQWRPVQKNMKTLIQHLGDGVNEGYPDFDIKDSEASYSRNMDSYNYPAASVMPGRSTVTSVSTAPFAIGERANSVLHTREGNTWKYWDTATTAFVDVTTGLTGSAGGMFGDFVTGTYRRTIYMNGTDKVYFPSTSTALSFSDTNMPLSDKFCVHKGRVYVAKSATVSYCGLNNSTDWTTANDSGSITITNARGDLSGIYEFNNYVLTYTEYSMHMLMGSGPSDYELIDIEGGVGCISQASLIKSSRILYWMGYDGVYRTDGSMSVSKISDRVRPYVEGINMTYRTGICSGAIGDFVYFSIPYGSTATSNNLTLKYDSKNNVWNIEDEGFKSFVTFANTLYGLKSDGQIRKVRDTSVVTNAGTAIDWSFITKGFTDRSFDSRKSLNALALSYNMTTNCSALSVEVSTNIDSNSSGNFTEIATLSASSDTQNSKIILPVNQIQNANWYRVRFAGTGPADIHALEKTIRERG